MCLLIATADMIDKVVPFVSVIFLFVHYVSLAPAAIDMENVSSEDSPQRNNSSISFNSSSPLTGPAFESNRTNANKNSSDSERTFSDKAQLQATPPSTSKNAVKARKNNNDLYFCCPEQEEEDDLEPVTISRKNKDRERNTKPPFLKRGRTPEEDEAPMYERRPALLLRFFPDGTAVLISKFQLHLHVKPKQIKFEPDDDSSKEEDGLDFNPGLILNDGKSYEVTYKRLEAIPSPREQNVFDLDESEEREVPYGRSKDSKRHEFVTSTSKPPPGTKSSDRKPFPLKEGTTTEPTSLTETDSVLKTSVTTDNKSEKLSPTVGDSPFFLMTPEEMSSLQEQYDPHLASPLKATTSVVNKTDVQTSTTTKHVLSTTESPRETIVTTLPSTSHTAVPATTTKCLSFKNQLSLALSTEDNIDNSLLKRQIFPTEDCDNSDAGISNSLARFGDADAVTTTPSPLTNSAHLRDIRDFTTTTHSITSTPKTSPDVTLPIVTRTPPEPTTTTQSYSNLVPYLSSQFSDDPSKPDVVVVTSLPVLIDLKSSRRTEPVQTTDVPWREVTVGVVRDQLGRPLKPRHYYNNWAAHLRGLRKKSESKFWNDFTTPKPDFRSPHSGRSEPVRQQQQQSPSQINRTFWTDSQRQNLPDRGNGDMAHLYRTNPSQNYPVYKVWRNRPSVPDRRWDSNANSNVAEYGRTSIPHMRSPHRSFENAQNPQNPQWNHGNRQQNNQRW